jgi:threonine/homoserine/homoserine lactone efflux protein
MDVDWSAFLPVAAGISFIPGANQLLGFRNAYRYGVARALLGVLGRLAAFTIMAVLVSLGLAALLVHSGLIFSIVKWAGVSYLAFLGCQAWWAAARQDKTPQAGRPDARRPPADAAPVRRLLLVQQEFVVAATNPKAVFLFAALLPQFLRSAGSPAAGLLLIGLAYVCVEAASATVYVTVGSRLRTLRGTAAHDRLILAVSGTCLAGFAVYLAVFLTP